jgi:oxaloacetate decarboxylase (Na+ extruding) subunit alpha
MGRLIEFDDVTIRDGVQSLWAMWMTYHGYEAVCEELDQAGFNTIEIPSHCAYLKLAVRNIKEEPWETFKLFKKKIVNTPIQFGMGNFVDIMTSTYADPTSMVKLWHKKVAEATGITRMNTMVGTTDEFIRDLPVVVPMVRDLGCTWTPDICYGVTPRHTDEYYAKLTRDIVKKYKPDTVRLKDAGGLLTVERIKTLVPAMIKECPGLPFEVHSHGTSTFEPAVLVEAARQGATTLHTCVRPLAFGSSHAAVDNVVKNMEYLGFETRVNLEPLKEVERKLRMIARQDKLPVGAPLEYDEGQYVHMVPGGVISNTVSQLNQLGIGHKIKEVLEEIPVIIKELGYPIMITPHSQFIVSQAAVNVALGERWKEVLDAMVEFAMGIYGNEDAGVPYMDKNLKDKLLSSPSAKKLAEYHERMKERQQVLTVEDVRRRYGMMDASDEEFLMVYCMQGTAEIAKMRELGGYRKKYYTGKDPLAFLLHELAKDHNLRGLEIRTK